MSSRTQYMTARLNVGDPKTLEESPDSQITIEVLTVHASTHSGQFVNPPLLYQTPLLAKNLTNASSIISLT